jgi:hypothetical protein
VGSTFGILTEGKKGSVRFTFGVLTEEKREESAFSRKIVSAKKLSFTFGIRALLR